jgi:fatty acid desaturase
VKQRLLDEENSASVHELSAVNNRRTVGKSLYILTGFVGILFFARLFFTNDFLLLFLLIGFIMTSWTQLAMIEELHDGYHFRLLTSRRANEILTILYACSVGISVAYARVSHQRHHRYFGSPDDPDYPIYRTCPTGVAGWLKYVTVHFSGCAAVQGLLRRQGIASGGTPDLQHPGGTIVLQCSLFGIFSLLVHPAAYIIFWLVPLLTLTFGMGRFRTMMDHWTPEPWIDPRLGKPFLGALYNFDGVFQRHIVGAQFGYNYHGMHHLAPSIPNYNLEKATEADYLCPSELVRTTTYYERLKEMLFNGYKQSQDVAVQTPPLHS